MPLKKRCLKCRIDRKRIKWLEKSLELYWLKKEVEDGKNN